MKFTTTLRRTAAVIATAAIAMMFSDAQVAELSSDYHDFVRDMDDLFKVTADKKRANEFIDALKLYMEDPTTDSRIKDLMIADCNRLMKMKARPFPHYYNCLSLYIQLDGNKNISGENFEVWHKALEAKMSEKNAPLRKTNEFIEASAEYAKDKALSRTPSLRWRHYSDNAKFILDGSQLKIQLPQTRITCLSQKDSIEVVDTEGTYLFDERKWQGTKGVVTWERCKLPRNEVNATFEAYNIDMKKNSFTINNAKFVNSNYFSFPLYGTLEHKVTAGKTAQSARYPAFRTSREELEIKDIFPNINYKGGFSQLGASFQGSGEPDNPARVTIFRNDTLFVEAKSISFILSKKRIESLSTNVAIFLDNEKIEHPGLRFRYMDDKREMNLIRGGDGIEKSLYFDTYHMVSMDIEFIRWKLDEPEMELRMTEGAANGYALFESLGYYREDDYNKIQGMEIDHPFQNIADFYRYNGGQPFYVEDYAAYRMLPAGQLRQQIILLSFDGFINYDPNTDIAEPRERMMDYLSFRLGKKDYDVIKFESNTAGNKPNGILDLKNYDINLSGVTGIAISDNQNVALYPLDGEVILKRNRDFKFDGLIEAGMLSLLGSGFYFSYEDFRIELNKIDEMKMKVVSNERGIHGEQLLAWVGNSISDLSGFLQIDEPDNKSGIKKNPQYPRLTSTKESYIYYDDKKIQNGKYKRETFYFTVDPFVFENVNNIQFNNTEFDGVLTSGIFPPIREKLVIRKEDYSLGFEKISPPEGYPIYNGRATFFNEVDLSNRGLHGNGEIEYVKSKSCGADFLFLPEEATGYTYDFTVQKTTEGTTFPGVELGKKQEIRTANDVKTGQTFIHFEPLKDNMTVQNTIGNFHMFPNPQVGGGFDCELNGRLNVRPTGLSGRGRADITSATLEGYQMDFTDHTIVADTSYFTTYKYENGEIVTLTGELRKNIIVDSGRDKERLYSTTAAQCPEKAYPNSATREDSIVSKICAADRPTHRLLMNKSMLSTIDFDAREGYFTYKHSNGNEWTSKSVKYKTFLKRFTWDMARNLQIMGQKGSTGNVFTCTKERGDSLKFNVPIAVYYGDENILRCEEVKSINTADARINLNKEGIVTIHQDAVMDPLEGTKIEIQTPTSYHSIYNSRVTIEGAKKYKGIGSYDFFNKEGIKYTIFMSDIHTDKDANTEAIGVIGEDITFDRYFAYKGKAIINAGRQLLNYDGGARMIHNAPNGPTGYVRFVSVIDPDKVLIPIGDKITNWPNDEIHRDFFMRKDSAHAYTSFIESRKDHSDISMLNAKGMLYYNHIFQRFDIMSEAKMANADTVGSVMSFIPAENAITGFGKVDLGVMLPESKPVDIVSAGDLRDNRTTNEITANILANIDFFFSTELATMMYNDILGSKAAKCDTSYFKYEQRTKEILDTASINRMLATRWQPLDEETGMLPEEGPLFTFDDMSLLWHTPKHAYICDTTVNLMMIRGRNVNRKVEIKSEFVTRKTGSSVDMLLTAGDVWYFFGYRNGNMQVLSSNKEFNVALQKIDPKDRRSRSRGVIYTLAPDSRRKRFLNNFGIKQAAAPDADEGEAEAEETEGEAAE